MVFLEGDTRVMQLAVLRANPIPHVSCSEDVDLFALLGMKPRIASIEG
jgi:hypothetical protein